MSQQQYQDYSGIITTVGSEIRQSANEKFQTLEILSFDNQYYLKTLICNLFGNKMRFDLKQGDLAVFQNGKMGEERRNQIFVHSSSSTQFLAGENEIRRKKGSDYLKKLKFIKEYYEYQQQQQQQFQNNQHKLYDFKGIIYNKEVKMKQIDGQVQQVKGIQFMNFDQQGHFQLYKIRLTGTQAHEKDRISQKILIKKAKIKKFKGLQIKLKEVDRSDRTEIIIGDGRIKRNMERDEYQKFRSLMDRKVTEMDNNLKILQINTTTENQER